jgi:membrane-bound lytic murein transglycosylase F
VRYILPHMNRTGTVRLLTGALLALSLMLSGCDLLRSDRLEEIRARGELRVATLNSPTTYFIGTEGPEGLEYELAERFATSLGVKLVIVTAPDPAGLRDAIKDDRADLAAAQLSWSSLWRDIALHSKSYSDSPLFWVYNRNTPRPRTPAEIAKLKMVILEDSAESNYLESRARNEFAGYKWTVLPRSLGLDPLELVNSGRADVTLMDGRKFAALRVIHPDVDVAFPLPQQRPLYWMVRKDGRDLLEATNRFLAVEREATRIPTLSIEKLSAPPRLPTANARQLTIDLESRLLELRPHFEDAAVESGLPWTLLAAVGYQESMWRADARSPHGAQGLMMIMPRTARSLGLTNPFDARKNILAGARYLAELRGRIPGRIDEPDRTWMAIAAYNIGLGHLEDARVLTARQGGNPDLWVAVRARLTLLEKEFWYLQTQHGYALGWETQLMVDRVQQYLKLIEAAEAQAAVGPPILAERQDPLR